MVGVKPPEDFIFLMERRREKEKEVKNVIPVTAAEKAHFCNLAFPGVVNIYHNPYFICSFPILIFLIKLVLLPLLSGKKSHPQNPCQDHLSFNKYTRSNRAKSTKILGKLSIIFKAILTEVNREPLLSSSNKEGKKTNPNTTKKNLNLLSWSAGHRLLN